MSEPPLEHPDLEELLQQYRTMVAGSHDANTALRLKIAIYQLALVMIEQAPIYWTKRDLKDIATMAMKGVDDANDTQRHAGNEAEAQGTRPNRQP